MQGTSIIYHFYAGRKQLFQDLLSVRRQRNRARSASKCAAGHLLALRARFGCHRATFLATFEPVS
jgi:hypothetical protein